MGKIYPYQKEAEEAIKKAKTKSRKRGKLDKILKLHGEHKDKTKRP